MSRKSITLRTRGVALGGGNFHDIHINKDDSTSSMYKIIENLPFTHINTLRKLSRERIGTEEFYFFETPNWINLLKIDIQGFELWLLRINRETLAKNGIVMTAVEFTEIYRSQPFFAEIDVSMSFYLCCIGLCVRVVNVGLDAC